MHLALSLHFKSTIFKPQIKIVITDTLLYIVTDNKNLNYVSIDPKQSIRHPQSSKLISSEHQIQSKFPEHCR